MQLISAIDAKYVRCNTFRKFSAGHSEQRESTDGVICAHCLFVVAMK
jgi:hypothetical protein